MTNKVTITVENLIEKLDDRFGHISSNAQGAIHKLKQALAEKNKLNDKITLSSSNTADEPTDLMKRIAQALSAAEDELNDQNLVITNALVEMNMKLDAGSGSKADTLIKFGIEPQSSH